MLKEIKTKKGRNTKRRQGEQTKEKRTEEDDDINEWRVGRRKEKRKEKRGEHERFTKR